MTEQEIKQWVMVLYVMRQERRSHPEGYFDSRGRWYCSRREGLGETRFQCRSPSTAWPYSYLIHARTKKHCQLLVDAALCARDVPNDVWECCPVRAKFEPGTALGIIRDYVIEGCPALS